MANVDFGAVFSCHFSPMAEYLTKMKAELSKNIVELHGRLLAACEEYDRDVDDITVVAITKTHPPGVIRSAVAAGLHNIGESRVQEFQAKFDEIGRIARFHMVGHLQTNKVKKAVQLFDVIQSVDSLKLAEEINKEAAAEDFTIECLIEVNCSGEEQKFGVNPDGCLDLVRQVHAMDNIDLIGLMTIGPNTDDQEAVRAAFAQCNELFKQGRDIVGDEFDTLSMGMSEDFPLAVAEGSTMIRVGSALFGPREF